MTLPTGTTEPDLSHVCIKRLDHDNHNSNATILIVIHIIIILLMNVFIHKHGEREGRKRQFRVLSGVRACALGPTGVG